MPKVENIGSTRYIIYRDGLMHAQFANEMDVRLYACSLDHQTDHHYKITILDTWMGQWRSLFVRIGV